MVLTAYVGLSPVTGLFCHRRLADIVLSKPGWVDLNSANLTPASGRQDHTILPSAKSVSRQHAGDRSRVFRLALQSHRAQNAAASTATHPAFVTIMIRPSCGVGWREFVEMICPTGEAKYFCKWDSTQKCPTGKSETEPFDPRLVLRPEACSWTGPNNTQSQRSLNDHDKDCGARNSDH